MGEGLRIVSDGSILNAFISNEHEQIQAAEIIFQYLTYKKDKAKIIIPPQTYDRIYKKLNEKQQLAFASFFKQADFIGLSDGVAEVDDLISIYDYLEDRYDGEVLLVSDEHTIENVDVISVKEFAIYCQSNDLDFYNDVIMPFFESP